MAATETKNFQIIQVTGEEEYLVVHPETTDENVLVSADGIEADNLKGALEEIHGQIEAASSSGVISVNGKSGALTLTKDDLELGNVDNTSDLEKPISTKTQAALDLKADKTDLEDKVTQDEIDAAVSPKADKSYVEGELAKKANAEDLGELASKDSLAAKDVGLGNVTNDAQVKRSEMGEANGVATLDGTGKVPAAQLPGFVDDVESYANRTSFPEAGEDGKIYIDKETNKQYRWDGESDYVEISSSLALGESASTAYAGNKGKANADAIAALQTRATTIESKNTEQDTAIEKAQGDATAAKNTANAAMPKAGGTFTGAVTLSGAPTENLHASTKKYVDDTVASVKTTADGAKSAAASAQAAAEAAQEDATANATEISNIKDGTTKVAKATSADSATSAGSATTATKLAKAQNFSIEGDVTAAAKTFDGSGAVVLSAALKNSGVNAGSYSAVTVNAKGIVTGGANAIEVGKQGQDKPSGNLAVGGLFFKMLGT